MKEISLEYEVIGTGKSILVIVTGIGCSFYDWFPFVESISELFTVVLYHRAGYGASHASSKARTTRHIAEELNSFLDDIGINEKIILLGHSFGGLCVQQFAKIYPNKISSVVLVDSTSFNYNQLYELNMPVLSALINIDEMIKRKLVFSNKTNEEIKVEYKDVIIEQEKLLGESKINRYVDFITNPILYRTVAEEFMNWEVSSHDIKECGAFPNVPLIVIARDNEVAESYWINMNIPENEAIIYEHKWRELQSELSQLSAIGELIIAQDSDHDIYLDRPDIIIDCLKKLS